MVWDNELCHIKKGLMVGLIIGFLAWIIIYGEGTLSQNQVVSSLLFVSSIAVFATLAILIRPIFRGKSFNTTWEGVFVGIAGFFDLIGAIIVLMSGKIPIAS